MAITKAELEILINAKDQASSTLKGIGSSFVGLGKAVGVAVAAGAGIAAVFGKESLDAWEAQEKAIKQLDAVLKSTGGVAKVTRDQALELSAAMQKTSTFADEVVLSGENILLTFTNIGKDTFPQATQTMLDMSAALGQDLKSSAIQLGKALQDPILGVSALRRVGVNFNEEQQKTIQRLVESGKSMEAQKLILKELGTEFGGSAAAQAETFGGRITQLKNQFGDFQEIVGEMLANQLKPFLDTLSNGITNLPNLMNAGIQAFKDAAQAVRDFFSETNVTWVFIRDTFLPIFQSVRDTLVQAWLDI